MSALAVASTAPKCHVLLRNPFPIRVGMIVEVPQPNMFAQRLSGSAVAEETASLVPASGPFQRWENALVLEAMQDKFRVQLSSGTTRVVPRASVRTANRIYKISAEHELLQPVRMHTTSYPEVPNFEGFLTEQTTSLTAQDLQFTEQAAIFLMGPVLEQFFETQWLLILSGQAAYAAFARGWKERFDALREGGERPADSVARAQAGMIIFRAGVDAVTTVEMRYRLPTKNHRHFSVVVKEGSDYSRLFVRWSQNPQTFEYGFESEDGPFFSVHRRAHTDPLVQRIFDIFGSSGAEVPGVLYLVTETTAAPTEFPASLHVVTPRVLPPGALEPDQCRFNSDCTGKEDRISLETIVEGRGKCWGDKSPHKRCFDQDVLREYVDLYCRPDRSDGLCRHPENLGRRGADGVRRLPKPHAPGEFMSPQWTLRPQSPRPSGGSSGRGRGAGRGKGVGRGRGASRPIYKRRGGFERENRSRAPLHSSRDSSEETESAGSGVDSSSFEAHLENQNSRQTLSKQARERLQQLHQRRAGPDAADPEGAVRK